MKIVFTGGNGMLAQAFKKVLYDYIDIKSEFLDKSILDITSPESIDNFFHDNNFDILINCAAYTKVDLAETESELANEVNGTAVGYLAEKCKEKDVVLISFSTDYVFDGENKEGYNENAKTNPLNAYGKSKEIGEKMIKSTNSKYYIIRTQWLYGPEGKNFVNTIINVWKEGKSLSIVNDQYGAPTFSMDLAKSTLNLILNIDKYPFGIYHLTNEGQCTWYDFGKYFLKIVNNYKEVDVKPVSTEEFPRPAKRPHYSKLINTKTDHLRSWEDAVKDYIENFLIT